MSTVLKISDAASLALHTAALLAARLDEVQSTRSMAEELDVSEAHLSKVLQRLTKVGLVTSVRGAHGGFQLAGDPEEVTLLEVYEAIDGPLRPSACLLGSHRACDGKGCILGDLLGSMNDQVESHFASRRLSDLAEPFKRSG